MKYPLPIELPKGQSPVVTQEFGDTSNVEWYKANGIKIEAHNGTDIVSSGGRRATYGARLVCPVPSAFLIKKVYGNPMSSIGNGIEVGWQEDGRSYSMRLWHCSKVADWQAEYKLRDTLGFIGNSGLVSPPPTPMCAHCGAHLHLMTYRDGALIDPRDIFDFTRWFEGDDTGAALDNLPIIYFLDEVAKKLRKIWEAITGKKYEAA